MVRASSRWAWSDLFSSKSVKDRIKEFMKAAYVYQGDIHEPYYLKVKWGLPEEFNCRLSSFDITYTSFDRDGTPLRAELKVSLVADERHRKERKKRRTRCLPTLRTAGRSVRVIPCRC